LVGWDRRVRVVVGVRGKVAVVVGIKSPGRGQGIHQGLNKHLDLDREIGSRVMNNEWV